MSYLNPTFREICSLNGILTDSIFVGIAFSGLSPESIFSLIQLLIKELKLEILNSMLSRVDSSL